MAVKHGNLSINSENIFPIIKKWLYSDHDIFVRELVSNGCDAITKLKKLEVMGEYTFPEGYKPEIQVIVNPDEKTLKFIDNGIGMTADEVEKYITQIAFSGATQFLEKYKDKTTDDQMIGHFGLGFYSAFMVAYLCGYSPLSRDSRRILPAIRWMRYMRRFYRTVRMRWICFPQRAVTEKMTRDVPAKRRRWLCWQIFT